MSFYQKYRPKKIAELDLISVRESLELTMKSGRLSHAYFFVGPRGSGKTSTARILAQVVNCEKNVGKKGDWEEPCGECAACFSVARGNSVDVIEIDAASSGLVDDIRDLREKVRLAPVQLTKKVYIIDEVHMVSTAGFNALLKTLEEPPKHAMFILCTTEAQKVPETIMSRCVRVNFSKASTKEIINSMMKAVRGESLDITEEALQEIAEATDGSFREGHKLLEQVAAYDKTIDIELVLQALGIVGRQSIKKLLEMSKNREAGKIVKVFGEMEKAGIKATILAQALLAEIRESMERTIEEGGIIKDHLFLIDELIEAADKIKMSPLPLLPLEIALLSLAVEEGGPIPKVEVPAKKSTIREEKEEETSNIVVQNYSGPLVSLDKTKTEWLDFLNVMSGSCGSLAGMLRLVSPVEIKGKSLTLAVTSRFQQEMLEREVKKKLIEEQMAKIWGPMTFRCVLNDKTPGRTTVEAADNNVEPVSLNKTENQEVLVAAEEIFGT